MFGLLSEAAPNHLLGMLAGANASEFGLEGQVSSQSEGVIQCTWRSGGAISNSKPIAIRPAIKTYLEARGEPTKFQPILNDCLAQITRQGQLPKEIGTLDETYFSQIQQQVSDALREEYFVQSFQRRPTIGSLYWLVDTFRAAPLSERMEVYY